MNPQIETLVGHMEQAIVGKRKAILLVICAMLSEGHILIEDVPGVGKTRLVSALSGSVAGKFNRIQLTPDIMPSDIVGFSMIHPQTRQMEYRKGVAMCNFLLADEINRASPKVQSALLEVMEEHQISLDGVTMPLPSPFMVLATQNPVETYGTYHLPEAQMDRFLMRISMGYPEPIQELDMLTRSEDPQFHKPLTAIMSLSDISEHIEAAGQVRCVESVKRYIIELLDATRHSEYIRLGASPRAGIALLRAAKSFAYISGREYVVPDDVKAVLTAVLSHRLILSPKGKSAFADPEKLMEQIAGGVSAPVK